jgi:hypothetical protein
MKALKIFLLTAFALTVCMACSDKGTLENGEGDLAKRNLLKNKLIGEWRIADEKDSYIYTFADNDTIYVKTKKEDTIERWSYLPVAADSIRIIWNIWTTYNRVVFYSGDSIWTDDFIPSDAAVYPPEFADATLKRLSGNEKK